MSKINDIAAQDFLVYATEVIKSRAIPYADDNLKPVHRRILYGMYLLKIFSDKPTVKSARIVGEVMGKFHPHGDSSIYEAMIRLSQPWKMRYPLINVQGNAGNIAGDGPAAARYTEANLSPVGDLMVEELKHKCVDYMATYDNSNEEPVTLSSMFPNILCNGNLGIAVGMSSDVVPHNLREAVDGIIAYIDNNAITTEELMKHIPGPDFPTGAVITTPEKLQEIYETGRGTITVQSKYDIEHVKGRPHLVFTEIPYLVSIEDKIIKRIRDLVIEEDIKDIEDIIDNSGRSKIEIRVVLTPKANVRRVLQMLFEKTGLQNNIKINNTVIFEDRPKQLTLKGLIQSYVKHRHKMIRRVSTKQQEKAKARFHLVEGLLIALQDIDGVIKLIKASNDKSSARIALMKNYDLTEVQANGILDMKLSQLTKLDADKLMNEKKDLEAEIERLEKLIHVIKARDELIKSQLLEMKNTLGDSRRTLIESTSVVAMNENKKLRIVLSNDNKVLVDNASDLEINNKGRKGKKLGSSEINQILYTETKNLLVAFDDNGKAVKVNSTIFLEGEETYLNDIEMKISGEVKYLASFDKKDLSKDYLVFITKKGIVKKTKLEDYKGFRTNNYAIKLRPGDNVMYVGTANDNDNILIIGDNKLLKFAVNEVRATGKHTIGVKGINAKDVQGATIAANNEKVIVYNDSGKGKVVFVKGFAEGNRGFRGQVAGDDVSGIAKWTGNKITIVGENNNHINLDATDIPNKSVKSNGVKIYAEKIMLIGN